MGLNLQKSNIIRSNVLGLGHLCLQNCKDSVRQFYDYIQLDSGNFFCQLATE